MTPLLTLERTRQGPQLFADECQRSFHIDGVLGEGTPLDVHIDGVTIHCRLKFGAVLDHIRIGHTTSSLHMPPRGLVQTQRTGILSFECAGKR